MKSDYTYFVYILTNKTNKVLYVGMTNNLESRIIEHKSKINSNSFSARYNVDRLVHYEEYLSADDAVKREKQLKAGSRQKKVDLVSANNPEWTDLAIDWDFE